VSPILDLQHRQRELGRIRLGEKGDRGQPVKLDKFRLTSHARHLLEHAAALWGGAVQQWTGSPTEGQWELYTQTDTLPIIIPPGRDPVTSWYESWSAGGCVRRCDGVTNVINDTPCSCDPDKRSCKATTRVNVMLPDLPDIGVWRLESHGINAAMELPGTISVILMASDAGKFLPGRLRIEPRVSKRDGQTNRFVVPVIDLDITSRALMAGEQPALDASETKFIESGASVSAPEAGVGHAPVVQVESPEPVVGSGSGDSPDTKTITQKQIGQMMATARDHNVSEDDLKTLVMDIAKVPSRKLIPADRFLTVIEAIKNWGTWQAELAPERQEDVG
jgi:hypothetical protein